MTVLIVAFMIVDMSLFILFLLSYVAGSLPVTVSALSPRVQDLHKRVKQFIKDQVVPLEEDLKEFYKVPENTWKISPRLEEVKVGPPLRFILRLYLIPTQNRLGMHFLKVFKNVENHRKSVLGWRR